MDGSNCRAVEGQVQIPGQVMGGEAVAATGMEDGDWRAQIKHSRARIVDKIMETLKRHLPFTGQEGLQELKKIAVRFEEKIYTAAISQSDYLRKISLKMLTMEVTYQKDSGASQGMQPRMQNNIGSTGVPNSAGSMAALPTVASMPQGTVPNVPAQNQVQQMQGVPSNIYANAQRQIQGRQQEGVNQPGRELANRHIKTRARLSTDPEVEKAQLELKKARLEFEEARLTWTAKFQL